MHKTDHSQESLKDSNTYGGIFLVLFTVFTALICLTYLCVISLWLHTLRKKSVFTTTTIILVQKIHLIWAKCNMVFHNYTGIKTSVELKPLVTLSNCTGISIVSITTTTSPCSSVLHWRCFCILWRHSVRVLYYMFTSWKFIIMAVWWMFFGGDSCFFVFLKSLKFNFELSFLKFYEENYFSALAVKWIKAADFLRRRI